MNHSRIAASFILSRISWKMFGDTRWDPFYDEGCVGFVVVVWTFVDFDPVVGLDDWGRRWSGDYWC